MLNHALTNQMLELSNAPEKVPFPKSNPATLLVSDPDFVTDLSNAMYFYDLDPHRLKGDEETKAQFKSSIKAAKTYRFKYNRDHKMPQYLWDKYHLRLQTLTLDHYINSIRKGYGVKGAGKVLLQGTTTTLNASSLTTDERDKKRLANLASDVIAEHMFLEDSEDPDVERARRYANKQYSVSQRPTATRNGTTPAMYDRTVVDYLDTIAKSRELCSEVYSWSLHFFSDKNVKKELEQVHESYLREQRGRSDGNEPEPFTAQVLVDYVTSHYITDNTSHIEELRRAFETVVRYKKESLHQWLIRLKNQVSQLEEAREGLEPYDENELKLLWKDTYVNNINFNESVVISHRITALPDIQENLISNYQSGVFDATFFEQFLLTNKTVLKSFDAPDGTVCAYNKARYSQKKDVKGNPIPPPDYNNPAFSRKEGNDTQKRKRSEDTASDNTKLNKRRSKKEVPKRRRIGKIVAQANWCTNQGCIERNAHKTHTISQCHYRNNAKRQKPSPGGRQLSTQKGNGPFKAKNLKMQKKTRSSSSTTAPKSLSNRDIKTVECFNCHKMGHYASDCPDKKTAARFTKEAMGDKRHNNFKNFMTTAFPEKHLRESAMMIAKAYGSSCCHQCGDDECRGNCDPDERSHHDNIPTIMERLSQNPDLTEILEETNQAFETGAKYAPLTVQSYFTHGNSEENFFHDHNEEADNGEDNNFFNNSSDQEETYSDQGEDNSDQEEESSSEGGQGVDQHSHDDEQHNTTHFSTAQGDSDNE